MSGVAAVVLALGAAAAASGTDFGIRPVGGTFVEAAKGQAAAASRTLQAHSSRYRLKDAAAAAAQWGRVTSTWRSLDHNRRVGGVRNSYHLTGRAIDIARAPNVRHATIEAALLRQGYRLMESLDEGDHSHFAFDFGGIPVPAAVSRSPGAAQGGTTAWRIVTARR